MNKSEIKDLIKSSIDPHKICRVFFKYDLNYRYYFVLKADDRLFLGAEEDDFILDGFSIRRYRDVVKAGIKDDKCLEIDIAEGLLDQLTVPEVDITDWKIALTSLQKLGRNIIIEKESLDEEEWEYAIGKVVKVLSNKVLFRKFDADGIWDEDLLEIPYTLITSITFGSRYVEIFSKYVPSDI